MTLEMDVPKDSSLDVSTGGGNIDAERIDGRVTLRRAAATSPRAKSAARRAGDRRRQHRRDQLRAENSSRIPAAVTSPSATVAGNAILHTSGGHIRAGSIQGRRGSKRAAATSLSNIRAGTYRRNGRRRNRSGEAAGLVRAKTGGGGIRVVRLVGPTDLQTAGGSILSHSGR